MFGGMGEMQTPTLNNRRKMTDDDNSNNPFSPAFQEPSEDYNSRSPQEAENN